MKPLTVCLICSHLCLSIFLQGTRSMSRAQGESGEDLVSLAEATNDEPSPLMSLLRTKRQSHLSLCSFCCSCCKNKGCGYCCRT